MILVLLLATSVVAGGCRGRHCGLFGGCFGCRGDCPYGCDTSFWRSSHRSCGCDCCEGGCDEGCNDDCDCGCSECGFGGQIDAQSDNTDDSTPPLPPVPGSGADVSAPPDVSAQNSHEPRELPPTDDDQPVAELAQRPGKIPSSDDRNRATEQAQDKESDTTVPTPGDEGANAEQQPTPATKDAPAAPPKTDGAKRAARSPLGYPRVVEIVRPSDTFSSTTKRIGDLARTLTGKRGEVIKAAWNSPPPRPLTVRERGIMADPRVTATIELKKMDLKSPDTTTAQIASPGTARGMSSLRINTLRRVRPDTTPTGAARSLEIKTTQGATESPVVGSTEPFQPSAKGRGRAEKKPRDAQPRIIRSTIRFRTQSDVQFKPSEQPTSSQRASSQRASSMPKKPSNPLKSST